MMLLCLCVDNLPLWHLFPKSLKSLRKLGKEEMESGDGGGAVFKDLKEFGGQQVPQEMET